MVQLTKSTIADYDKLSNQELHTILCGMHSEMSCFPVTDWTRETVVAMLKIAGKTQGIALAREES